MKKIITLAAIAAAATVSAPSVFAETSETVRDTTAQAAPAAKLKTGQMLYSNGSRVAAIYHVTADGNPQVILNGKLVTVPASTISSMEGKATTSLTKKELAAAK